MDKYGRWIYGQHPTDDMIEGYVNSESMYFAEENGIIIAAAAVTFFQAEDYHSVQWNVAAGILGLSAGIFYCITGNLPVAGIVLAASG